jgi:hypothetical protein
VRTLLTEAFDAGREKIAFLEPCWRLPSHTDSSQRARGEITGFQGHELAHVVNEEKDIEYEVARMLVRMRRWFTFSQDQG